ncbi:MAG: hypothetical protein QOG52_761, partial [Frankiaceae bacterium]|nr:hypothetical protein [Frankiaceae bacterium]
MTIELQQILLCGWHLHMLVA